MNKKMNILKRITMIILLAIALLILPQKAFAATFKTINGTKRTGSSSETKAVNFYNTLMNYNDSNKLPEPTESSSNTYYKWIGTEMGNFSINWNGTYDNNSAKFALSSYLRWFNSASGDKATCSVCFEPGKDNKADNGVVDSSKNYYIGQILVVDNQNVYLYQKDSKLVKVYHCGIDKVNDTYNWQKTLYWAYQGKSNATAAWNFAKYITSTTKWKEDTQRELKRDIINTNYSYEYNDSYRKKDKNYNYRGVFVWSFSDNDSGQGTMYWNVTRYDATPEVDVKIKKVNQDNNLLSGATIYVNANYSGSNVKSMFMGEDKVKNNYTSLSTGSSWDLTIVPEDASKPVKLKVTETTVPLGYTGVSGTYEITINYDRAGKITGITGGTGNVAVSGRGTDTAQVTIKNQKIRAPGFIKTDFNNNEISNATFDVYLEHLNGLSIEDQKFNFATYSNSYRKTRDRIPPYYKYNEETKKNEEVYNYGPWYYFYKTDSIKGHALEMGCVSSCSRNKDNGSLSIGNTTTGNNWSYMIVKGIKSGQISNIEAWGDPWNGRMIISETSVPDGYEKLTQPLSLIYSNGKWCAHSTNTLSSEYYSIDSSTSEIKIKNDYKLNNLNFAKYAYNPSTGATGDAISGTKFNVTLKNVKHIDGYSYSGETLYLQNVDLGALNFRNVVFDDTPIEVTLEEVSAPVGYKRITGTIKLTIARNGDNYTITNNSTGVNETKEFGNSDIIRNGHAITVNIKNIPIMNLGGIVWEDGQLGEKGEIKSPNGKYDWNAEEGLSGVQVELLRSVPNGDGTYKDEVVTKDVYGTDLMRASANGGESYKYIKNNGDSGDIYLNKGQYVFPNIERDYLVYAVRFTYDGINYQTVPIEEFYFKGDKGTRTDNLLYSTATEYNYGDWDRVKNCTISEVLESAEKARSDFNNRFKTISKGMSNDETTLSYTYSETDKTSKLNVENNGENPASDDKEFKIQAISNRYIPGIPDDRKSDIGDIWRGTWNNDGTIKWDKDNMTEGNCQMNINCGLYKKEVDLALGTDVKSATLKINDKETTYSYAQIMNGDLEDVDLDKILQNNSSTSDVDYNLYLYTSDYNYRISDYKTGDDAIKNTVNTDDNTVNNYENLKELEAYITYSVILKNQTTYNATVEQFVYYYDAAYIPQFKVDDVISGYKVVSIENNKITFESVNSEENILQEANSYRKEIDLTFEVRPDDNGNITTKTATNVAEITKYSTVEGGLIDKDSEPGNASVEFKNGTPTVIGNYEDDTDEAKGINISVREDEVRTITGTVFDDTYKKDEEGNNVYDKDGILNNENTPVNDVIVQLIEIKKIGGQYYEYIWQETKSGSNEVKTTARNGYPGEKYTNGVEKGSGMYEFKDFIPGDYIIRFRYGEDEDGDGRTNNVEYNGQDYKSTIDTNYNKAWYNTAEYTDGQSVARDNEARRLEVMEYSSTIDKDIGKALDEKTTLDETRMCAETSRINVPGDADNKATDASRTTASYDYTKNNKKVSFNNVNFGLALRPKTNLVLEKHITGLKITPSGTGVQPIVDARADISKIIKGSTKGTVDGGTVEASGVTQGLATIKSTRTNRGFWQVATDIEELAQGAQLEVEYTYVIRNDGEEDYLSSTLVEAYEKKDEKAYNEVLLEIKNTVKGTMRSGTYSYGNNNQIGTYLGQTYYRGLNADGSVPDTDAVVSSRIETLEEALNNDLTFDSETSGTDFKVSNPEGVEKTVYDTDGNTKSEKINTVVVNDKPTSFLIPKAGDTYTEETADYSKTITLRTILSATSGGELGANLPSHIAEVVKYSNAAGRRDMGAEPENLSYVHSDNTGMTLENSWLYELEGTLYETQNKDEIPEGATNIREANERDEFWGETIIITKPTGEDKLTPLQIAIITISSIAVIGVGIVLIKKFVLKK